MRNQLTTYKIKLANGMNLLLKDFYYSDYPSFCSFALRFIHIKEEAEDVVQNVFISLWQHDVEFNDVYALKSWFYQSIKNSCLDLLKHKQVKHKYQLRAIDDLNNCESFLDEVLKQEAYNYLYLNIRKLPDMEKKVLLYALKGYSNSEISEVLGIKLNTVKTHKARAYKALRGRLNNSILLFILINSYFSQEGVVMR